MIETIKAALAAVRRDGWENVILGLGGEKDPSASTRFAASSAVSDTELEAAYVNDHFAARIIEALPRDALRPGWDVVLPGSPEEAAKTRDAFAAREDELGVPAEISQGACWGRLFGGAVTWVGADDGLEAWKPIDEANIKTLSFLHTFDRRDVWVETYYQNPRAPKFRQPETYRIRPLSVNGATIVQLANAGRGIIVHESRLVIWPGQPTTDLRRVQLNGWDDSVLQRCWDALRQVGEDFGAKSLLLGRVSQAIYKIKGLYAMLAGKEKEHLETRIGMLDASRSRARAVVLDTDEDFINVTQPLSGVEALMDRSMLRLASAADMPVTILMGQAPAGMQATGEADQETWERAVSGWRANVLRARHERIARLMLLAKDGPTGGKEPDHWLVKYRPVRTARPLDAANARKLQVDADAVLIDKGVVTAADVAIARCSPSAGGDIVLDQKTLQANVERQRLLADAPPKDNAELGTVGARATSVLEIINAVTTGRIARESGIAVLTDLHRFTLEVATAMLGPEAFKPTAPEPPKQPGPPPAPPKGEGAGAPQGSPGFDAGGDPKGEGRG